MRRPFTVGLTVAQSSGVSLATALINTATKVRCLKDAARELFTTKPRANKNPHRNPCEEDSMLLARRVWGILTCCKMLLPLC